MIAVLIQRQSDQDRHGTVALFDPHEWAKVQEVMRSASLKSGEIQKVIAEQSRKVRALDPAWQAEAIQECHAKINAAKEKMDEILKLQARFAAKLVNRSTSIKIENVMLMP